MFKRFFTFTIILVFTTIVHADNLDSIFVAPDVFISSKIKPSTDFEGDRANIFLDGNDLDKRKNNFSIGGMLKSLPGMSSQGLANASRPLIRGMTNSRVKILQNSSSLADVSEFGLDHIVAYDPMLIDKIEVIKGPATLLYGNNAFAGAVNIINPLIDLDKMVVGQNVEASFGYSTSGGELKTALKGTQTFDNFTVRGMGSFLSSGSYDLANTSAVQVNSAKFNATGGFGLTYNDGKNYLGFSLDRLESEYSLPGGEGVTNRTTINPSRNTINVKSALSIDSNLFEKINFEGSVSEYNHAERVLADKHNIEFFNDNYEIKTSVNHKSLFNNNKEGLIGFHYQNLNQGARGDEESHLTTTKTNSFGLFALEKFEYNSYEIDLGGRIESVNLKNTSQERGFFPASFSSTVKRDFYENNTTFVGFDFTQRAPNPVELFANGAHHALENYEIGLLLLKKESSYNFSIGHLYSKDLNKLKVETYVNYIKDFIASDRNGNTRAVEGEDFNVVKHDQYNAMFTGVELSGQYNFTNFNNLDIVANFMTDIIKGYRTSTDTALSRVPQSKFNVGLQALGENLDSNLVYSHYITKGFTGPHQTRTGGHSQLDFDVTQDFSYLSLAGHAMFSVTNLLDTVGRDHLESKKDSVQLPGRSFNFMLKLFY